MSDSVVFDRVDAQVESDQAGLVEDRRRPGRIDAIDPTLLPLLRGPVVILADPAMFAVEQSSDWSDRRPPREDCIRQSRRDALDLLEQLGTTISVRRDQKIHGPGDQATSCYRVLHGCVRMVRLMEDGRRQIGEFLMAGDLFGFDALNIHDYAAEAVSDLVLRRYPRPMVDMLAESNLALALRLWDLTLVSLRAARTRLLLLGRKTASEKIATFLLEMRERLPCTITGVMNLPMGRTDMADHLGLTIETVCRVLTILRRDKAIAIERNTIEIRDLVGLQQMASEARH